MPQPERYDRIEGLQAREPVDAVLTVGEKILPKGFPGNTDRFFLHAAYEEKVGKVGVRPNHPAFTKFNDADPKFRRSITGYIVHPSVSQCFRHRLSNPKAPEGDKWSTPPSGRPFCEGDGKTATRFYGLNKDGTEDWKTIPCPNELCEFRQGEAKLCKPLAVLYFRPEWPAGSTLPTPLMKYETRGWDTARNMLGFFEYIENSAKALGVDSYTLFGFRFVLTLHRKTNAKKARAFPVVTMSPDVDPLAFFMQQRKDVLSAGGRPTLALVGAQSEEENEPAAIAESLRALSGERPTIPGEVIDGELMDDSEDSIDFGPVPVKVPDHVKRIIDAATRRGISTEQLRSLAGAPVDASMPAGAEHEVLRAIAGWKSAAGGRKA